MVRSIRDCKVAVVGGAGFLGSHLVDHLIDDRGCEVLVIDNLVAGRREFIHPQAEFAHHDITGSEEYLTQLFMDVDYVFNYAAYPYIPVSFERPLHVFNVNAMGALKVINAAYTAECSGILQVSSAEIYGDCGGRARDYTPIDSANGQKIGELGEVRPHSSYGVAKAAIDAMVQVRFKEAHTQCIALRQFNCVGARETHPYIVPEIISQLSPQIYSDASPTEYEAPPRPKGIVHLGNNSYRDFMWAGDAVRSAVLLLENGTFGEVYNLGSTTGIKMYDLASMIGRLMGFDSVRVEQDPGRIRPWEIWHLQSDNSKIESVIGPQAYMTLEQALGNAIAWYRGRGRRWPWETTTSTGN